MKTLFRFIIILGCLTSCTTYYTINTRCCNNYLPACGHCSKTYAPKFCKNCHSENHVCGDCNEYVCLICHCKNIYY